MDQKVVWTDNAKFRLENIFFYYKGKAGLAVTMKITSQIIAKADSLEKQPTIGRIEELLENRQNTYRYIIQGNYKIIYWIEDKYIKIATIFDCRQNPKKIRNIK